MPSATYVVFLRGINVGKANRIAMTDLKAKLTIRGAHEVISHLQSGNLIFKLNPETNPADLIQSCLEEDFSIKTPFSILDPSDMQAILKESPFQDSDKDPSRLLAGIPCQREDLSHLAALETEENEDKVDLGQYAAYIWCLNGVHTSKRLIKMDRLMKKQITFRNWKTIKKIASMLGS